MPLRTRVIIFNGPPRCGKDTVCKYLVSHFSDFMIDLKMSYSLKKSMHSMLGMHDIDVDYFDSVKDIPIKEFYDIIPREGYIDLAERYIKNRFGKEHFGNAWLRRYWQEKHQDKLALISDAGFTEELEPLKRTFGDEGNILIRIHRKGHDFRLDSRGYIPDGFLSRTFDFENPEGAPMKFITKIVYFLEQQKVFTGI